MRRLLLAITLCFAALPAQAATCFWVGGTGTWNNSTDAAHWSSGTGGSGSTCGATGGVPKNAADVATFDGASGGGTVTVNTNLSITQITCGAFTGTLDWSANNNSATLANGVNCSGTGTRTLNLGNGTWTISPAGNGTYWNFTTTTGLTFNANSSIINHVGGATGTLNSFVGGGLTYNVVNFSAASGGNTTQISNSNTFATVTVTAPMTIEFFAGNTQTITNAFTWTGTANSPLGVLSGAASSLATISVASGTSTCTWCAIHDLTFTGGGTFTASNSLNLGHNAGITITAPSVGGGGGLIGIIGG